MRSMVLMIVLLLTLPAQAAQLKDMRLWQGPDSTRVVFDLSASTTHNVFTLDHPDRLVIDIVGVEHGGAKIANRLEGLGVVQKVRSASKPDGALRVVLDLASPVSPKSFILEPSDEYGYRLVVDLYNPAPQPAAPAATEAAPPPASIQAVAVAPAPAPVPTPAPAPVATVTAPALVLAPALSTAPVAEVKSPAAPVTPRRPADKPIVIAVDAGHGGEDPGARGKSGLLEKDVALALARQLAKLINAEKGMKAVLTRDGDYYVGLRERVEVARKAEADLFVSVHANAYRSRDMHGTAVYVLSPRGATNEHARWLAHKENSADMVGGIELKEKDHELAAVLIDLSQNATMEASFDVGSRILESLKGVNALQKRQVQQAGFVVLKAPDIPSVLVETAFITNDREERLLGDEDYREKMARSILTGVKGYFRSYRPQQQVAVDMDTPPGAARAVEVSYTKPAARQGDDKNGDGLAH